jgi:hypothetical protein
MLYKLWSTLVLMHAAMHKFSQNDKANGHGRETDMHNGGSSKARTAVGA